MLRNNRRKGSITTEWAILIALFIVALIIILTIFGNTIKEMFKANTESIQTGNITNPTYNKTSSDAGDYYKLQDLTGGGSH
jgi:Flp pilus assembly pilin Flp